MTFTAERPQRIDVAPIVGFVDEGAEMNAIIAAELLEQVIRAYLIRPTRAIRYAMGKEEQLHHHSSQLFDDVRADQPRHTERQSLPDVDEALVFGIERIHVRDAVGLQQHVFVMQRLGFEAPVLFETVGTGVAFAAAVIEDAYATLCGAPHQVPVHEVVAFHFAGKRGAAERGVRVFDYGRSKRDTGSYSFKKNWGFEAEPLHYEYVLVQADGIPDVNPLNPKYQRFINIWKRLPLGVTRLIGPHIVKQLG